MHEHKLPKTPAYSKEAPWFEHWWGFLIPPDSCTQLLLVFFTPVQSLPFPQWQTSASLSAARSSCRVANPVCWSWKMNIKKCILAWKADSGATTTNLAWFWSESMSVWSCVLGWKLKKFKDSWNNSEVGCKSALICLLIQAQLENCTVSIVISTLSITLLQLKTVLFFYMRWGVRCMPIIIHPHPVVSLVLCMNSPCVTSGKPVFFSHLLNAELLSTVASYEVKHNSLLSLILTEKVNFQNKLQ